LQTLDNWKTAPDVPPEPAIALPLSMLRPQARVQPNRKRFHNKPRIPQMLSAWCRRKPQSGSIISNEDPEDWNG
jgi:hypothetical protein